MMDWDHGIGKWDHGMMESDHGVMEWVALEGTPKIISSQQSHLAQGSRNEIMEWDHGMMEGAGLGGDRGSAHPDPRIPFQVFGKVAAERRGKVRVFFCGSAGLARIIRQHCQSFGFAFSKENF